MKRVTLAAFTLVALIGAALWGVNYRLDHPPLTKADREFRALVAGADSVRASQMSCQQQACAADALLEYKPLTATQTRELIEILRFAPKTDGGRSIGVFNPQQTLPISLDLTFFRADKKLAKFELTQTSTSTIVSRRQSTSNKFYKVNPRFNKRLNRALNEYLPQRIRP